ncbi:hypothetical protein T492DRAFT_83408 [Pavlovales sp. CCMP2436]|nr:hypothetical protein T492DRAFT_83408 [Pavlovales sp. CCMP2436]
MAALSGDLTEVERRLLALRNQAGQMQYALDMPARAVSPPRQDAWAAARSPGPPTGGLDPSAPDFLNRLADLKEQHARNLRELEMQLRAGAGVLSRSPAAAVRPAAVRPRSAGAARALASSLLDEAGRVERAAELDELIASVRARRGVDTSRLDAARQRFHHRPRSAPHRRPPTPRATVPQPFAFERRDEARRRAAMRERTTRQRRHSEGEAAHYRPFKAQPVPVSTVEPRYEYMVTQAEQRRTQIATECRQNLETAVKPFSFLERPPIPRRRAPVKTTEEVALEHKFKAKVVPPFVSMRVYEQMQHDDAVRCV